MVSIPLGGERRSAGAPLKVSSLTYLNGESPIQFPHEIKGPRKSENQLKRSKHCKKILDKREVGT
jgi:hypothetical protein